ncbi:MAG: hypothetical protein ACXVAX_06530 [Pseudobdellovibrio sp.]
MKNTPYLLTLLLTSLLSFAALPSCTQTVDSPASSPAQDYCSSAGKAQTDESAACTTNSVYSSPAIVSGTASFYKRGLTVSTTGGGALISSIRLGAPIPSPLPIKYAEVRVLDSNSNIVQCGVTDANGSLKALNGTSDLQIPNTAGSYTVQVLARSNHAVSVIGGKPSFQFYTSVKDVCTNDVHKISTSLSVSGTGTVSATLTAYARESESSSITGGAFNIFNDLGATYDYLGQNTGTENLSCLNPKLHVYWTAGFNPGQFIDPYSDPSTLSNISFYLRGYNELYINGGKLGNVTSADTDHFDDSVILHEFGHHVEDVCGKMDSPGGTHYGQFRIDPRLAWSEGWGNFFGAHMVRNNLAVINPSVSGTLAPYDGWLYYLDTQGYSEGSVATGDELIRIDLSRPGDNPEYLGSGYYYDQVSSTTYPGEGHFREVSISRSLFKTTNTCAAGTCTGTNYFADIWKAFQSATSGIGMGKSIYPFRSSIRFYNRLREVFSNSLPPSIVSILDTDEAQQLDGSTDYQSTSGTTFTTWVPYAVKLVSNGNTPCNLKIQPRQEYGTVTYFNSDQRYSNHFYHFDRNSLPSVSSITLTATKVAGTSTDIDLILFQEGYAFPDETCADSNCTTHVKNTTSSEFVRADRSIASTPATTFTKQIRTLNTLSTALPYLLDIKAYTADKTISDTTQYIYYLQDQNGDYLCPTTF